MDMNTAFDAEVKHWCPKAKVVYDLFHVVAKYGREVVARVRVDAANALRGDKRQRKMVKSVHWLLLKMKPTYALNKAAPAASATGQPAPDDGLRAQR